MEDDNNPDRNNKKPLKWHQSPFVRVGGTFLLAVTVIILITWIAYRRLQYSSYFLATNSDPTQYVTGNLLQIWIILAVALQAIIYLRMATQNERLIRASEESANVARDAFHIGEAPYFGISNIEIIDLGTDRYPRIRVKLWNGGKTPAWRIHTAVKLGFGKTPEQSEFWKMAQVGAGMLHTFIPAGQPQEFEFYQIGFAYNAERERLVNNREAHLFVVIEIHHRDFRKVWHSRIFRAVWQHNAGRGRFHDYDASERHCKICKKKGYDRQEPN